MGKKNKEDIDYELDNTMYKTKQQEFDFGDLELTSTLDTSFTTKKGSNRIKNEDTNKFQYIEDNIVINKKNTGIVWTLIIVVVLLIGFISFHFITFNHHKVKVVTKIKKEIIVDKNYLFLGDSITDFYDLDKYYEGINVVNSGISGNTTKDILKDMNNRVYRYNPSKVFLLIGTNDIQQDFSKDEIVNNIKEILNNIKDKRKYSELYLESIYPVDEAKKGSEDRTNKVIKEINSELKSFCKDSNIKYIDLYSKLVDHDDILSDDYSNDGLHLNDEGYEVVTSEIKKYLD